MRSSGRLLLAAGILIIVAVILARVLRRVRPPRVPLEGTGKAQVEEQITSEEKGELERLLRQKVKPGP